MVTNYRNLFPRTTVCTSRKQINIHRDFIGAITYQISVNLLDISGLSLWAWWFFGQKVIYNALYFTDGLFEIQTTISLIKTNTNSLMSSGSTDLASGKLASSSSVLGDLKPQLAVDSNPSPDSHKMSCFFSSFEDHPWWSVDLGLAVNVQSVTVTTRNKAGNHNSMCTWYHHVKYRHRGFVFEWLMWVICQYFVVAWKVTDELCQ